MIRYILLWSFALMLFTRSSGQEIPDSLVRQYNTAKTEKEKLFFLYKYVYGLEGDPAFLQKTGEVIKYLASVKDQRNQDLIQLIANDQLSKTGDYATALASCLEILARFERKGDKKGIFAAYRQLSTSYFYAGDKGKDVEYGKKAMAIALELNDAASLSSITNNISTSYSQQNNPDSALVYGRMAVHYARQSGEKERLAGVVSTFAEAFIAAKQYDSALYYTRQALFFEFGKEELAKIWALNDLSQIFLETHRYDSAEYYARMAAGISVLHDYKDQLHRSYDYLSQTFEKTGKPDSAFKYLRAAVAIKDSLYNGEKIRQVQGIMAREQNRLQEIEHDRLAWKNKMRIYGLIAGLVILGVVAFILLRNNRQKKKANEVLENTLMKLRSTQTQLIQSEKMASLGELTAGIAHEIQNPLNFVNNFSEVNIELVDELRSELSTGNMQSANDLADTIKENSEKISHHGKRADGIVKGMLQHSRNSNGQKELTDINNLVEECMRLSYHGLRAKDKSFNSKMKTEFSNSIPKINVASQDIGRVVLNLFTNAFYSVMQKQKQLLASSSDSNFDPLVLAKTAKTADSVIVSIRDNGNGVPQSLVDKIFQPFYTTKPVGEGTGLGLSISYDIITKGHGGELKVETKEGEFAEFTIILPVKS